MFKEKIYRTKNAKYPTPKISFEDYFESKSQTIEFNFAIDFTGANGCVKNKDSLHFLGSDDNNYIVSNIKSLSSSFCSTKKVIPL